MQAQLLERYLKNRMTDRKNLLVTEFIEITDGWETEIYAFSIQSGADDTTSTEKLVLRLYAGPWAKYKARKEFSLLKRLYEVGYPVPKVSLIEVDSAPLGRPFIVMERIEGSAMWNLLESAEDTSDLYHLFSKLFVNLHEMDLHLLFE